MRWRQAVDPFDAGSWQRRLEWHKPDPGSELATDEPAWLTDLAALLSNLEHHPAEAINNGIPFADALQSIVDATWTAELSRSAQAARLTDSAITGLRRSLLVQLSALMARPLGHQFSAGRTLTDVVMSHLVDGLPPGDGKSRYDSFCRDQVNACFSLLLEEFPVLGRLMATVVRNWSLAAAELLDRVTADRALIERRFSVAGDAQVTSVEAGLGDRHRGGRGVAVLTFEPGVRLVYKPRPVDIEARYHEFIRTVSTALFEAPLRTLEVLACGSYGYVEYLKYQPVRGPEQLPRFYRNAGRTLGLLYILGATDCHWENMIASADQLVLVDAETLLEGTPYPPDEKAAAEQSLATDRMTHSILRTGMLPAWISVGPSRAIDISALGAPVHQGRVLRATWCFVNSDDMVWGEREVDARHPDCSPVGPGLMNRLVDFTPELASGLEETLSKLLAPVKQRLARTCIENFRGASRRVVVRPTRTYVLLQDQATEPEALRDPDERGIRLDKLSRAYIGGEQKPRTWPLLLPELDDMEALDIPYFESFAGSTLLRCGDRLVAADYYEKEGLTESIRRLEGLSDAGVRWQTRLLHGAIAAHRFEMAGGDSVTRERQKKVGQGPAAGGAASIARRIIDDAIEDPLGPPTWLTVSLMADATRVQLGLVPAGLYDGRTGIAAFLYDCGETAVGDAVMAPVLDAITDHEVARVQRYLRTIGFGLSGASGILRLMEYLNAREQRSQHWRELSARLLMFITNEALTADKASDLVSGIAGLAGPVAVAHARAPGDDTARVLHHVGRLLVERQDESGGWPMGAGLPALAGLSTERAVSPWRSQRSRSPSATTNSQPPLLEGSPSKRNSSTSRPRTGRTCAAEFRRKAAS